MNKFLLSFFGLFLSLNPLQAYAVNSVNDLFAEATSSYSIRLTWTVPAGSTPDIGSHFFKFRSATSTAGPFVIVPTAQSAGVKEISPNRMQNILIGFDPDQNYCFVTLHTEDFFTWSDPSNISCAATLPAPTKPSHVVVVNNANGWVIKVDSQPYVVKGVAYSPTKIGEDPANASLRDWMVVDGNTNAKIDAAYDSFVDKNKNNLQDASEPAVGDFQLMKQMGVNTIRLYHHPSNAAVVQAGYGSDANIKRQYNHAPNKALLRDLYKNYGICVAMGDLLGSYVVGSGASYSVGTDYRDATQRERMKASVKQMVLDFKDEPFLLLYILGNENNYDFTHTNAGKFPTEYATFVEEVTQMIHQLDPNHPVAICSGDLGLLSSMAQFAPSVDIFGTNVYRGSNFGPVWQRVEDVYKKPVLITEYGTKTPSVTNGVLDEVFQESTHRGCWQDIVANMAGKGIKNSIGGVAFTWLDNWWQNGAPFVHNSATDNQEWHGLYGQGNGTKSPFLREERKVVATYKSLWVPVAAPLPTPSPTPSASPASKAVNPAKASPGWDIGDIIAK